MKCPGGGLKVAKKRLNRKSQDFEILTVLKEQYSWGEYLTQITNTKKTTVLYSLFCGPDFFYIPALF